MTADGSATKEGLGSGAHPSPSPAEGPHPARPLHLFEKYGIEIEYMIVDAETLDVRPVADRLFLRAMAGQGATGEGGAEAGRVGAAVGLVGGGPDPIPEDVEVAGVEWSNEVALHVLELKTPGPAPALESLPSLFQGSLDRAHELLAEMGMRLLPGGAHPWMDPETEFRIWPHEYTAVYDAFDRIFSCRGHGWANLQSTHINFPFADDAEFGRLHEAIRWILPLIPALAASSPILDGVAGPALDRRLVAYRDNQRRVPSVTGRVVPERARSEAEYVERILEPIFRDLAPMDPHGILMHEWANSRGAIARFGRGSIEIRVIDAQECPLMDLAVAAAVVEAVKRAAEAVDQVAIMGGSGSASNGPSPTTSGEPTGEPDPDCTHHLADQLAATTDTGRRAALSGELAESYGEILGLSRTPGTVGELWRLFLEDAGLLGDLESDSPWAEPLAVILEEGSLAERILVDVDLDPTSLPEAGEPVPRGRLESTYRRLAECLAEGRTFRADPRTP